MKSDAHETPQGFLYQFIKYEIQRQLTLNSIPTTEEQLHHMCMCIYQTTTTSLMPLSQQVQNLMFHK